MAKLKAPFLSLGARGTLGNSFTTSRHPSGTVAKRVPSHPDAQTLPQLYHRWRFYDANQYWNSLSSAARAVYRDQKYPRHLTPHQKCIRAYLLSPPDLALWLRWDLPTGQSIPDHSPNSNNCTLIGTTTTPAIINLARLFDGIDDYGTVPVAASISNFTALSIFTWLRLPPFDGTWRLVLDHSYEITPWGYAVHAWHNQNRIGWRLRDPSKAGPSQYTTYTPDIWHHFGFTWDGTTVNMYYDNAIYWSGAFAGPLACTASPLYFAADSGFAVYADVSFDDYRIYTRALTPTHIAYLYQRERYPLPP